MMFLEIPVEVFDTYILRADHAVLMSPFRTFRHLYKSLEMTEVKHSKTSSRKNDVSIAICFFIWFTIMREAYLTID